MKTLAILLLSACAALAQGAVIVTNAPTRRIIQLEVLRTEVVKKTPKVFVATDGTKLTNWTTTVLYWTETTNQINRPLGRRPVTSADGTQQFDSNRK